MSDQTALSSEPTFATPRAYVVAAGTPVPQFASTAPAPGSSLPAPVAVSPGISDLTLQNLGVYVILWISNGMAGCLAAALAAGNVPGFGSGQFFAPFSIELAAGLSLLIAGLTLYLAANRPRLGREDISHLVSQLGTINARAILTDMATGRVQPSTSVVPVLSDADVDRIAERFVEKVKAEMDATVTVAGKV